MATVRVPAARSTTAYDAVANWGGPHRPRRRHRGAPPHQVGEVQVQQLEDPGRGQAGERGGMHGGPRLAHDHGGGQATPGDVADPDAGAAPAEVVDVPPVTADLDPGAPRDVAGGDPQARQRRGDVRQQGALQVACDLALLVEGAQVGDGRAGAGGDVLQERHVGLRVGAPGVGTDQDDPAGDLPRDRERQHGDGVTSALLSHWSVGLLVSTACARAAGCPGARAAVPAGRPPPSGVAPTVGRTWAEVRAGPAAPEPR